MAAFHPISVVAETTGSPWGVVGLCTALTLAAVIGVFIQERRLKRLRSEFRKLRTDLTRANERAASSRGEKAHILRLTLEDLAEPLSVIEGAIEAAQKDSQRLGAETVTTLGAQAQCMRRTISSLRELQALDVRSRAATFAPINVGAILHEAVSAARSLADTHSVRLSPPASSKGALARADAGILRKVLSNLLSQAIAVSPPQSAVSLSFYTTSDRVLITVNDEGPGATVIDQAQMLSESGESRPPMPPQEAGAPLNLAMIHNLIGAMEGFFWSQTEPGRGTTHVIELPLAARAAAVEA
ncbi:MAG TPA: HAMP domain-containing sensor histidine kinase [Opitutaceae bacterium]|nr:HAMP domain-containing sensor histidine kinase [Opitutaceae bacterium]